MTILFIPRVFDRNLKSSISSYFVLFKKCDRGLALPTKLRRNESWFIARELIFFEHFFSRITFFLQVTLKQFPTNKLTSEASGGVQTYDLDNFSLPH